MKEENYRDLFPTEKERFVQLVEWTKNLFMKNSIRNLIQWTSLIEPNKNSLK